MMATADNCKGKPFTFLWTIENVPMLTPFDLQSPRFVVNSIRKETWYLQIIENEVSENEEKCFCCWLRLYEESLQTDDEAQNLLQEIPSIAFEFSILAEDGSILISKTSEKSRFYVDLLPSAVFAERRDEFIPNDKLTVRFRMWKWNYEILTRDFCFGRTKLMTWGKSFIWAVKEFSALRCLAAEDVRNLGSNNIREYTLEPLSIMYRPMTLILYLEQNYELENVNVVFMPRENGPETFGCQISVLNAYGEVIASKAKNGNLNEDLKFSSLISRSELMANKKVLVPNDSLFVRCYLEVPFGDISSKIEYCTENISSGIISDYGDFASLTQQVRLKLAAENNPLEFHEYFINEVEEYDLRNLDAKRSESECEDHLYSDYSDDHDLPNCSNISDFCKDSCKLRAALKELHNDTKMSDISLKIGTKVFPAHKNLLSSRSAQFRNVLFEDKVKTTIDIEDMDENILCRLLQYIYTNTVEELDLASAFDLYKAAEHYQLLDLRNKCSCFLGKKIRKNNLSEILSLAKKCGDEELEKKVEEVQEFYKMIEEAEVWDLGKMMKSLSSFDSSSSF